MNDKLTATKRTTWNAAALTFVVFLIEQFTARDIDVSNPILIVVVPALVGVFYRASLELSARFPALGRVLFGDTTPPTYERPAPATTGDAFTVSGNFIGSERRTPRR